MCGFCEEGHEALCPRHGGRAQHDDWAWLFAQEPLEPWEWYGLGDDTGDEEQGITR